MSEDVASKPAAGVGCVNWERGKLPCGGGGGQNFSETTGVGWGISLEISSGLLSHLSACCILIPWHLGPRCVLRTNLRGHIISTFIPGN